MAAAYGQLTSDGFTGVRTATGDIGDLHRQSLAITPAGTPVCFSDNFNRASLGANWATSNSKAGSTPAINTTAGNQRLPIDPKRQQPSHFGGATTLVSGRWQQWW